MFNVKKRFVCCTRATQISIDFEEQEGAVPVYNGLNGCILDNQVFDVESRTSREDVFVTDSIDDNHSSCSSSKDVSESVCSKWFTASKEEKYLDECELSGSPEHIFVKDKELYAVEFSDVEAMKEKFANLLLGEDVTGGRKGVTTAVALSNAITSLAASVFGELWKLEPLTEEKKNRWQQEMDWLLSPTNYMVEFFPAKQSSPNGILEVLFVLLDLGGQINKLIDTIYDLNDQIMASKPRTDIYMNLPALQKLDSILIETLDSMVNTEFWYTEVGSKAEGRNKTASESKRWWLPSPQVQKSGLSETERNKLESHSKVVHQVLKAAKAINESVLSDMPVPTVIKYAFPKSGKICLGDELYKVLSAELDSPDEMIDLLNLKSEHTALETVNKLEAAVLAWRERITEQGGENSAVRRSLSFGKDVLSEMEKAELLFDRAESLLRTLTVKYPNLPQTFLNSAKVKYGTDIGHSVLEAYSRVLGNLAFSILSRIEDVLHEDSLVNPS